MLRLLSAAIRLALTLAVTFLGLLLITFLIGRVVPIDPVLAVVGDRASAEVYEKARMHGCSLPVSLTGLLGARIHRVEVGET